MGKSALVVINSQHGFFENTTIGPVYKSRRLLKNLKQLVQHALGNKWLVVFVKQDGINGSIVEKNSEGWDVHAALFNDSAIVISKTKPSAFEGTSLQNILQANGINRIFLSGLQTEICIRATSISAIAKNYKVYLVEDAHSTWSNQNSTASDIIKSENFSFKKRNLGVINVDDFLSL